MRLIRAAGGYRVGALAVLIGAALAGCGASGAVTTSGHLTDAGAATATSASRTGSATAPTSPGVETPDDATQPPQQPPQQPPTVAPLPASALAAVPQSATRVREIVGRAAATAPELRGLVWTTDRSGVLRAQVPGRLAERTW